MKKFDNFTIGVVCLCCFELCLGYKDGAFFGILGSIVFCLLYIIEEDVKKITHCMAVADLDEESDA